MRKFWALGTLAAFIVAAGSVVAAQQAAPETTATKYKIAVRLPAAITAAFKQACPNATIRGTSKETEGGKTVYEVESVENGRARDFIYTANGTVIEAEEEMNPAELPAPVAASVKKLYPTATIAVAEKTTRGTTVQYELQLKGAAKKSVALTPDGKPVAPEKK